MKHLFLLISLSFITLQLHAEEYDDSVAVAGFLIEINNEREFIVQNIEGYDPKFITKLEYFQYNLAMKNILP